MTKPAVILVGADKGGVGKTTVARTLLDYFGAHHTPTRAFDTESPRGTLKRFHPDVTEVVDVEWHQQPSSRTATEHTAASVISTHHVGCA